MTRRDRIRVAARRLLVAGATIAVVLLAVATVSAAAHWRSEAAAFDPAPIDAVSLADAAAAEAERTADLEAHLRGVARQVADLQQALIEANATVDADAAGAQATRDELAAAAARLERLQGQLDAAKARLAALNRAAARQAALNRAAAGSQGSGGGAPTRRGDDDDEHEHEDGD